MDLHLKYLANLCRICGSQIISPDFTLKTSSVVMKYCSVYEGIDFSKEDSSIFPLHICFNCVTRLRVNYLKHISKKEVDNNLKTYKFERHERENCLICCTKIHQENTDPKFFNKNHMKRLSKCCRICKSMSVKKKAQLVHKCSIFFIKLFDSDTINTLNSENIYIYPQYFCEYCYHTLVTSKFDITEMVIKLGTFEIHNENCWLCNAPEMKVAEEPVTGCTIYDINDSDLKTFCHTAASLAQHRQNLEQYCRLCTKTSHEFADDSFVLLPKSDIAITDYFKVLFNIEVQKEDKCTYPPGVCSSCYSKLKFNYIAKIKRRKFPYKLKLPELYENNSHQCKICSYEMENNIDSQCIYKNDTEMEHEGIINILRNRIGESSNPQKVKKLKTKHVFPNLKLSGLPIQQLSVESKEKGIQYLCTYCNMIPAHPVLTVCEHIYCEDCLKFMSENSTTCAEENCLNFLCFNAVLEGSKVFLKNEISGLIFNCGKLPNEDCNFKGNLNEVMIHQAQCYEEKLDFKKFRSDGSEINYLFQWKNLHLSNIKNQLNSVCEKNNFDYKDAISYLHWQNLKDEGNFQEAEFVKELAYQQSVKWTFFTDEQSLSLKIMFFKTLEEYKREYNYLKNTYFLEIIKPPEVLDNVQKNFLPNDASYRMLDFLGNVVETKESSLDNSMNTHFINSLDDTAIVGASFSYRDAIAKTIQEILLMSELTMDKAERHLVFVEIKDGMKIFAEKQPPSNILRASFCILRIFCFINGVKTILYNCDASDLYKGNRDFLIAYSLCKEALESNISSFKSYMEEEQLSFKHRLMEINFNDRCYKFYLKIFHSVYGSYHNEEFQQTHLCTLHNEDGEPKMEKTSCFTFGLELKNCDTDSVGVDALQCDTALANIIREILIHETSNKLDDSVDKRKALYEAELKIDDHFQANFGFSQINIRLFPRFYTNKFIEAAASVTGLKLITDSNTKCKIQDLCNIIRKLRNVYNAEKPSLEDISQFSITANVFLEYLKKNFIYICNLSHLKKSFEFAENMLREEPYSIGILSSEGIESGHQLFRAICSRRSIVKFDADSLGELLNDCWIHTSPKLCFIAMQMKGYYQCGVCKLNGHNISTCSLKKY